MSDSKENVDEFRTHLDDHTPLIHPLRSASRLVEIAIPENLFALRLSEWRPAWLRQALKGIKDGKSHGFTFPDIHLAAIFTNNLFKAAGAYHELKGHINTLLNYALPMIYCVVYHDRLFRSIWLENRVPLDTLVSTISSIMEENVTHELIADRLEIDVLRPYVDHRYYGGKAKERINFLEELCGNETWYCDMCGGPLCTHRASMYISSLLVKRLNLTTAEIGSLVFGISNKMRALTSRPGTFATEGEIPIPADAVLLDAVRNIEELHQVRKDDLIDRLRVIEDQRRRRTTNIKAFENLPGKYSVPISDATFVRNHLSFFESFMRNEETTRQEGGFPVEYLELTRQPLSTMIAKSFIVATRDEMSLYLPREFLPEDEPVKTLSLNALIDLKLLAVATYGYVNPLVQRDWVDCASRRGTQCLFKERLGLPTKTLHLERVKSVLNCLVDDSEIHSICKRIADTLLQLSKARQLKQV